MVRESTKPTERLQMESRWQRNQEKQLKEFRWSSGGKGVKKTNKKSLDGVQVAKESRKTN